MKLSYVCAAIALLAAPAFAEGEVKVDPSTVTCNDFTLMDEQHMTEVGIAVKESLKDDERYTAMTDEQVTEAAKTACTAHPEGKVIDALKM